jgi:hypothetical protein
MSAETNDNRFSDEQRRVLASVLDEIIPPTDDGRLPGAGRLGVGAHIETALRSVPELGPMFVHGLAELDAQARSQHGTDFPSLARADKLALLNQQGFVFPLTLHAFIGYYQDDRVVQALGLEPRPPHPKGYDMEPNDLSLLDPVRRRPRLYRES